MLTGLGLLTVSAALHVPDQVITLTVLDDGALTVREQTSVLCNAKLWLGHIGFQIVFGSLFGAHLSRTQSDCSAVEFSAKTYRLHRIFNNILLRGIKISDGALFSAIGSQPRLPCCLLKLVLCVDHRCTGWLGRADSERVGESVAL